jgi:hypothetical protein
MTDDGFARRLPDLMHELARNDERYIDGILAHTVRTRQRPAWTFPTRWLPVPPAVGLPGYRPQVALGLALVALIALLLATAAYVGSQLVTERPPGTSYEAAFLRLEGDEEGHGVVVVGVTADGREREVARLPDAWNNRSSGFPHVPPMGAVSPSGLLAIPSGGTDLMMRWEIYDLHSPNAEPLVVPGIAEQFIEQLRDRPSWRKVEGRGGVFWGPEDRVAIAWYPCTPGAGSCIVRMHLSFVDGRTGATSTVVLADLGDDLFVAPVWASDGSGVFVAATDSSPVPAILHPDGTLTAEPDAIAYPSCRLPEDEPAPTAPLAHPHELPDGTGPGCLSPDGTMIAVDPGGYGPSRSQLVNVESGESYSIDGTFAGWLGVSEDEPEPTVSPDPTDISSPEADATDALGVTNGWIAFSTQPGYKQVSGTDWAAGGDIYLVREGTEPRIIVERGADNNHNVCPQFSPDGSRLAYGELAGEAPAIVVLDVSSDGRVEEWRRFPLPGPKSIAPCPRWSRGGTHLAYLDGVRWDADGSLESRGTAVRIVDVDGNFVDPTVDDPSAEELRQSGTFDPLGSPDGDLPLLSPDGKLRALATDGGLLVGPPDGSADRLVPARLWEYSLAGWSPDGAKVLLLSDGGRHATMAVISVMEPLDLDYVGVVVPDYVAKVIPVNGARSWPGRGDVSWQSVHP